MPAPDRRKRGVREFSVYVIAAVIWSPAQICRRSDGTISRGDGCTVSRARCVGLSGDRDGVAAPRRWLGDLLSGKARRPHVGRKLTGTAVLNMSTCSKVAVGG
jgi:hypothetical protein